MRLMHKMIEIVKIFSGKLKIYADSPKLCNEGGGMSF